MYAAELSLRFKANLISYTVYKILNKYSLMFYIIIDLPLEVIGEDFATITPKSKRIAVLAIILFHRVADFVVLVYKIVWYLRWLLFCEIR